MSQFKLIIAKYRHIALFLLASATLAGCSQGDTYRREQGMAWNTLWHMTYRCDRSLADSIAAVMSRVEMSLSPFGDSTLISAVNRGEDVVADSLLRRVFAGSLYVNKLSNGLFDPTVGPLVELWGFGRNKEIAVEPSDSAINAALSLVGIDQCSIDSAGHVTKKHPATTFNFSAIAKGLGCDEVAAMLRRNGVTDYMIEIGGEIALGGTNPDGEPWRIAIDSPSDDGTRASTLSLTNCGIATSGNYRNYRDLAREGGSDTATRRVGHTIDPRTGRPSTRTTLSATVIAPDCMSADALATACMAMHADSAYSMITALEGVEAMLILPDSVICTPGLADFAAKAQHK